MLLWNFINSARTSLVLALSLAAMTTSTISTDSYAHRLSFFQKYVKLAVPFLGYGLMQFCKERSAAERLDNELRRPDCASLSYPRLPRRTGMLLPGSAATRDRLGENLVATVRFMNRLVSKIAEIAGGEIITYSGDYEFYEHERAVRESISICPTGPCLPRSSASVIVSGRTPPKRPRCRAELRPWTKSRRSNYRKNAKW